MTADVTRAITARGFAAPDDVRQVIERMTDQFVQIALATERAGLSFAALADLEVTVEAGVSESDLYIKTDAYWGVPDSE